MAKAVTVSCNRKNRWIAARPVSMDCALFLRVRLKNLSKSNQGSKQKKYFSAGRHYLAVRLRGPLVWVTM
jgi:hypothetical protein